MLGEEGSIIETGQKKDTAIVHKLGRTGLTIGILVDRGRNDHCSRPRGMKYEREKNYVCVECRFMCA